MKILNMKNILKATVLFISSLLIADVIPIAEAFKYNLINEFIITYENYNLAFYKMCVLYGIVCTAGGICLYFLLNRKAMNKFNFEKKTKNYYINLVITWSLILIVWFIFNKYIVKTEAWQFALNIISNLTSPENLHLDEISAYTVEYALTLDILRTTCMIYVYAIYSLTRFLFDSTILIKRDVLILSA